MANNDKQKPKDTLKDSVNHILQNKADRAPTQGPNVAQPVADAIQGEVADVMAGVEVKKPSEKAGERAREQKKTKQTGSAIAQDDQQGIAGGAFKQVRLPSTEVMIKRIRIKIQADIQAELKQAAHLTRKLKQGSAQSYNAKIARVRKLKHVLHQLLTAAQDFIKDLYLRLFHPSGKPREHSVF